MTDATANRVQPWLDDGDVQLYHGDALTVLQGLPAGIAQTCVTSPPYWGLRDYGATGQLGLEATPAEYVERIVAVFREVRRVLRDDGTLWLNLGDSYTGNATSGGINGNDGGPAVRVAGVPTKLGAGLKPKDLVGIPWRVAFALQADGWYLRSDIIWSKPNPMPESVTDRPTKAHEYLFLFSKRPRYYFDADAIREPHDDKAGGIERFGRVGSVGGYVESERTQLGGVRSNAIASAENGRVYNPAGRNRRSVWTIPTEPFPEAHFATYPQALVTPCILAGTSEKGGCVDCGAPWQRISETSIDESRPPARRNINPPEVTKAGQGTNANGSSTWGHWTKRETTGWSQSCECPFLPEETVRTRPQLVFDPFIGSGTTALVARKHGRRCIGIDLSVEYLAIAAKRTQQLSLLGGVA